MKYFFIKILICFIVIIIILMEMENGDRERHMQGLSDNLVLLK
jgi:preprotein translocase subunit SecG